MDTNIEQLDAIISRAASAREIVQGGLPYLIVPSTHRVEEMERLLPQPTAKRGTLTFTRRESFVAYVTDHKSETATRMFFNGTQFQAVLDHHSVEKAGWKQHVAIYAPSYSPEWLVWIPKNKTPMKQADFSEFIEENRSDVLNPDAGALLDMVRELESVRDVTFKGTLKKDNTVQRVEYEENTVTRAKGDIEFPTEIVLKLPVFDGENLQAFPCRLRVVPQGGTLCLSYEIRNLTTRLQAIKDHLVAQVQDESETVVLFGYE